MEYRMSLSIFFFSAVSLQGFWTSAKLNRKVCLEEIDEGRCENSTAFIPTEVYGYSKRDHKCVKFLYHGCGQNSNRFSKLEKCRIMCKEKGDFSKTCSQEIHPGYPCEKPSKPSNAYGYSKLDHKCVKFKYLGCGGNTNRFLTERRCRVACKESIENNFMERCTEKINKGKCGRLMKRRSKPILAYGYSMLEHECKAFKYHGCGGNLNRFLNETNCREICNKKAQVKFLNRCSEVIDHGKCDEETKPTYVYGYSEKENKCEKFDYYGCGGNSNRFSSRKKCDNFCTQGQCLQEIDQGFPYCESPDRGYRYGYSKEINDCIEFAYYGCAGNINRFTNSATCREVCVKSDKISILNSNHISYERMKEEIDGLLDLQNTRSKHTLEDTM